MMNKTKQQNTESCSPNGQETGAVSLPSFLVLLQNTKTRRKKRATMSQTEVRGSIPIQIGGGIGYHGKWGTPFLDRWGLKGRPPLQTEPSLFEQSWRLTCARPLCISQRTARGTPGSVRRIPLRTSMMGSTWTSSHPRCPRSRQV